MKHYKEYTIQTDLSIKYKTLLKEYMNNHNLSIDLLDDDTLSDYISELIDSGELSKLPYREINLLIVGNMIIQNKAMSVGRMDFVMIHDILVEIPE